MLTILFHIAGLVLSVLILIIADEINTKYNFSIIKKVVKYLLTCFAILLIGLFWACIVYLSN